MHSISAPNGIVVLPEIISTRTWNSLEDYTVPVVLVLADTQHMNA